MFGNALTIASAAEATAFIAGFDPTIATGGFQKYEASTVFSNGDDVRGSFAGADKAVRFLHYVTA